MGGMAVKLKRVYDAPSPDDGHRVLVDRLWPRGLTKERAAVDSWAKDAAPSAELRRAFHRGDLAWEEFEAAYRRELTANPAVGALRGRFVLSGDAILSSYASPTGRYRGFECITQLDEIRYTVRGALLEEDKVISTWALELTLLGG